jgi:hypothetical protein
VIEYDQPWQEGSTHVRPAALLKSGVWAPGRTKGP